MGAAEKFEIEEHPETTIVAEFKYEYGQDVFWICLASEFVSIFMNFYKPGLLPRDLLFYFGFAFPLLGMSVARTHRSAIFYFVLITMALPMLAAVTIGLAGLVMVAKGMFAHAIFALWLMFRATLMEWTMILTFSAPTALVVFGLRYAAVLYRSRSR